MRLGDRMLCDWVIGCYANMHSLSGYKSVEAKIKLLSVEVNNNIHPINRDNTVILTTASINCKHKFKIKSNK